MKNYRDYPKLNNERINFSKISGTLPLPNLVEIQTKSYKSFLEEGIGEVLKDVFPIDNYSGTLSIEYVRHELGKPGT
jgi:DNA-directed RNA polymerase subunit beta